MTSLTTTWEAGLLSDQVGEGVGDVIEMENMDWDEVVERRRKCLDDVPWQVKKARVNEPRGDGGGAEPAGASQGTAPTGTTSRVGSPTWWTTSEFLRCTSARLLLPLRDARSKWRAKSLGAPSTLMTSPPSRRRSRSSAKNIFTSKR